MTKRFFFFAALLFTQSLLAQHNGFHFGLKAGISVGKLAILPSLQHRTEHYGTGIEAGGFLEIPLHKKLNVYIEPLYNLHRSSLTFKNTDYGDPRKSDLSLHQVSLPVHLGYIITSQWSVLAGVSANYNFYFTNKVTLDNGASPATFYTFNITN